MLRFCSDCFLFESRCFHSDRVFIQLTQFNRSIEQVKADLSVESKIAEFAPFGLSGLPTGVCRALSARNFFAGAGGRLSSTIREIANLRSAVHNCRI